MPHAENRIPQTANHKSITLEHSIKNHHDPMFEQTFRNIDDILYKDAGADSELDYIEQTSWVLFLRYLDALEQERRDEAELEGRDYTPLISDAYRWSNWAVPRQADGEVDQHRLLTGPDLVDFVNDELWPYLTAYRERATGPQTIEYKIGEIFGELKNKVNSGYNLRAILDYADSLPFLTAKDKHELSHLYETKIKNMGNAGRNGGQYYTPRPLIRAMIEVLDPQVGETVYDGAVGSAGFLCEAYEYMYEHMERTTTNVETLQTKTFYGREKKNLAYIIGVMNMILHGIEAPNIVHTNTLAINLSDIQQGDRYDVILANPPFGGKERAEVQTNFPIRSSETAFLFLQHFIKSLKAGGRAAVVIKNTFLSNSDSAATSLRQHLLESCQLDIVLDLPGGTFPGTGVKTVVLFFTKGQPTSKIWYYQLDPGRTMGKTTPLNDRDMADFITLAKVRADSEQSWTLDVTDIEAAAADLSARNPHTPEEAPLRSPVEIMAEIESLDGEVAEMMAELKGMI